MDLETLKGFFRRSPFIADLGVEPTEVQPGVVTTQLPLQPRFLQHSGVVHAGVMATMADHTMGAAAQSMAAAGRLVLTAELKTSLLRTAKGDRWCAKVGCSSPAAPSASPKPRCGPNRTASARW